MNWTIPEFVKSSVGSPAGTRLALGTTAWPRSAKNSTKRRRISAAGSATIRGSGRDGGRHRPQWYRTSVPIRPGPLRRARAGGRGQAGGSWAAGGGRSGAGGDRRAGDDALPEGRARRSPPRRERRGRGPARRSIARWSSGSGPPATARTRASRGAVRRRRSSARSRADLRRHVGPRIARSRPSRSRPRRGSTRRRARKSPIRRRSKPSRAAERVAGPRAEERGEDEERQPPAGRAADQDVQRRRGRSRRGGPGPAPGPITRRAGGRPATAVARIGSATIAPPATAIRPPPRTTSPSYRTAAWPGAAAQTGSSVSTIQQPPRAGSWSSPGGRSPPIGVARWRIRIVRPERSPAPGGGVARDEADAAQRRRSASRGPRAGRAGSCCVSGSIRLT